MFRSDRFVQVLRFCALMVLTAGPGMTADPDTIVDKDGIKPRGEWYEATVPDTLDLAERAEYSINALSRNLEPDKFYAVLQGFNYGADNYTISGLTWNITPKNLRGLPMMRTMCGSDENIDIEYEAMRALVRQVHPDGQIYYPFDQDGPPKDTSYPLANGIAGLTFLVWHARDGNPAWLDLVKLVCQGLKNSAIEVEDRAYWPPESSIKQDGSWHFTDRENAKPFYEYTPPDEPDFDQQGFEGSIKFEQSQAYRLLALCYALGGDPEAMETARKVVRFVLKPGMWENTDDEGYSGHEHGIWAGHFHANITNLHALLDVAMIENSQRIKQIVREGYDHAIRQGVVRIGWFPGWTLPEKYKREKHYHSITELCGLSDMVILGVKMSDAGMGDYWDDVDAIVRNQFTAQQIIDMGHMRRIAGGGHEHDADLARFQGGFGPGKPTQLDPTMWGCCTANGAIGLYYAWHGITRFRDGVATVNLFLNRASKWMDIDSHVPYEGKVVLRNKLAHTASVRIPSWVDLDAVRCEVNDEPAVPAHYGRRLLITGLNKGDTITLTFPLKDQTDKYFIHDKEYTFQFRGSTVVDVAPRADDTGKYPIYLRDRYKAGWAPMRKVKRFAAADVLDLQ